MKAPVINIADWGYPAYVPVINGAETELVSHRILCGKYVKKRIAGGYQVNYDIKTWAAYFQLKALSSSGCLQFWTKQKSYILSFLQMNENSFRRRLKEMNDLQLVKICKDTKTLWLTSYEKAAGILGIGYNGLTKIKYNPDVNTGKQIFQYFLRAEEFRSEQQRQLDGFTYRLDENPKLKNTLRYLLVKQGADDRELDQPNYFQQRLLQLQMRLFKTGSTLLESVLSRRADINRSVNLIAEHHGYKSKSNASYLKKVMAALGIISVKKICVESKVRSRIYVPDEEDPQKKRDAYKWLGKNSNKKWTAWFLTDQVSFNYESKIPERQRTTREAA